MISVIGTFGRMALPGGGDLEMGGNGEPFLVSIDSFSSVKKKKAFSTIIFDKKI